MLLLPYDYFLNGKLCLTPHLTVFEWLTAYFRSSPTCSWTSKKFQMFCYNAVHRHSQVSMCQRAALLCSWPSCQVLLKATFMNFIEICKSLHPRGPAHCHLKHLRLPESSYGDADAHSDLQLFERTTQCKKRELVKTNTSTNFQYTGYKQGIGESRSESTLAPRAS